MCAPSLRHLVVLNLLPQALDFDGLLVDALDVLQEVLQRLGDCLDEPHQALDLDVENDVRGLSQVGLRELHVDHFFAEKVSKDCENLLGLSSYQPVRLVPLN
jgi:hypothetical protein